MQELFQDNYLPPVAELTKNATADKFPKSSARLTFAQPKVQSQLDPGVLSTVLQNGTWGSVYNNQHFGDGNRICKSMGFAGGTIKDMGACPSSNTDPIHWAGLHCNGTETSPYGCSHHELTNNCSHENDLAVSGNTTARFSPDCWTPEPDGFAGGRLEVFGNGHWGTVCHYGFDTRTARVACTQLGYPGADASFTRVARSCPPASGRSTLLSNLRCNGDEKSLLDCYHGRLGVHYCLFKEDVAVRCIMPALKMPTTLTTRKMSRKMGKKTGIIVSTLAGGVITGSLIAVYLNARKLRQENNDLSTCQLIRKAVVISIRKPLNLCLQRGNPVQPTANDTPASIDIPLHHDMPTLSPPPSPPPSYEFYEEFNAFYIPPPTYEETNAIYITLPTYDESNAIYMPLHAYDVSASTAPDVESVEMATFSTMD